MAVSDPRNYLILLNRVLGPTGLTRWEVVAIITQQDFQNNPNLLDNPNIQTVDLYRVQEFYFIDDPIPWTGDMQEIRSWLKKFEIKYNELRNRTTVDARYVEVIWKPNENRWRSVAILPYFAVQHKMRLNLSDTKYIPISEANRYAGFSLPGPINPIQSRQWIDAFDQSYNTSSSLH